jgi:PilZ domain
MSIERRLHPRILMNWPATLHNVQGSIEGETKDISVDGVFIFLSEKPKVGVNFPILLKPSDGRSISLVGKKVWSSTFSIDNRPVFGMGVRFIHLSPEDQQYIASLVEKESRGAP